MLNSSYLLTYLSFPMECVWLGIGGALGPDTGGWWVTGWGWWWLSDWCNHSARVGEWLLRFLVRQIHIQVLAIFYSRMRSKGFRFTLGVEGPQPSATVRAIPVCRAYGKFCRGDHFWRC
jgi:hypothetical protein